MNTKNRRSNRWLEAAKRNGGSAAVEFALILPVLLTMLFIMLEFGVVLNSYLQLTVGVRDAARQFAISRGSATPWSSAKAAFTNGAPSLTAANLTLTFTVAGTACSTDAGCTALLTAPGLTSSVTASYDNCTLDAGIFNFNPGGATTCTLSTSTTELVE